MSEPTTRSRTVLEVRMSPGRAAAVAGGLGQLAAELLDQPPGQLVVDVEQLPAGVRTLSPAAAQPSNPIATLSDF
jgi:hypothetical protein